MSKQTLVQWLAEEYGSELRLLYVDKQLTSIEMANLFGVSKHTILHTLDTLKVPRRHTRGMLYHYPERKPTKEQLDKWLNREFNTLGSIANKLGCDPAAIRNWALEYGIEWDRSKWGNRLKHRGFVDPSQEQLENLYLNQECSMAQIADLFTCSRGHITKLMKKHRIPLRLPGWKAKWFKCNDGHRVRSTYEQRVDNWLFSYGLLHTYEPSLPFDPLLTGDFLVGQTYIEVWGVYDNTAYEERKKRKCKLYAGHNLTLIEINRWDFAAKAKDRWQRKLSVLLLKS